jgi:hypothetical protein
MKQSLHVNRRALQNKLAAAKVPVGRENKPIACAFGSTILMSMSSPLSSKIFHRLNIFLPLG